MGNPHLDPYPQNKKPSRKSPRRPSQCYGNWDYKDRLNPSNSFSDYQIGIMSKAAILHSEEKAIELIEKYNLEVDGE